MLFLWILLGTDAQSGTGTSGGSGGFGGGGVGLTGVGVHGGALGGVAGLGRGTGITSGLNNNLLSRSATSVYPGMFGSLRSCIHDLAYISPAHPSP
jgi:hypothetical protein